MTVQTAPAPLPRPATRFDLPPGRAALEPPERRGLARDEVRLLAASPGRIEHRRFFELPELLAPGDLLVVNTSRTLPAAVDGVLPNGARAPVHVSTPLPDGSWTIEVRLPDNTGPNRELAHGASLRLPGAVTLTLDQPYPDPGAAAPRLWRGEVRPRVGLGRYLARYGRPIRYGYAAGGVRIGDVQTVYASEPGSAEMPSAGRPFSSRVLVRLIARGVTVAPLVLHAGVSSLEAHEAPLPERFAVPPDTARLVRSARRVGRRVVAVGTTVVRALETAARPDGEVRPASGWTDLVLGPNEPVLVVDGLITGWHPPEASHLLLLEAVAGPELVGAAYRAAVAGDYRWHEFGDSALLLP